MRLCLLCSQMKTVSVALVLCLNVGVDPPDVVKTTPCARLECWIGKRVSPAPPPHPTACPEGHWPGVLGLAGLALCPGPGEVRPCLCEPGRVTSSGVFRNLQVVRQVPLICGRASVSRKINEITIVG